ncbi:hypothetical protein K4F52_009024 [Lecanicillium sp. MT-2017a]|nr:hypothetical protein K4F52_009024 [Lecanicillium sp. MT-2017a]
MATTLASTWEWMRRKQVQIEVTFAVYMFTPWEKFTFWSIVFLLFSLTFIAAVLYLPHHISILAGRAWYYINGENADFGSASEVIKSVVTTSVLGETGLPEMTKAALDTPPIKAEL